MRSTSIQLCRSVVASICLIAIMSSVLIGQVSIPASRQADRVAIITIEGPIDQVTAMSVRRRIEQAESGGFGAMVFEINSPGGGVGAVLDITGAIKGSTITNTIAWVNTDAYSGGAIIALACQEIVSSTPAAMGDAFPVIPTLVGETQKRGGLRGLTPDERTKLLPVLLADVTDSARRYGYDEYLVQAIVIDGIELWLVEDNETGARWAINENEYTMLFNEEPPRGKPMLAEVTGGRATGPAPQDKNTNEDAPVAGADEPVPDAAALPAGDAEPSKEFQPASDTLRDVEREFQNPERLGELTFEFATNRPQFSGADADRFRFVSYVTDGSAPIVMREDQLQMLGFSSGIIRNDDELKSYMGAETLVRQGESVSDKLVRFLTNPFVRGFLIVVFLVALFVELIAPGFGLGGGVALITLALLLAPPMIIGLAGWWEILAIGSGIALLLLEAFVLPGFGVFGVLGAIALFGGLLGTFVPAGGSFSAPATQQDMLTGATTILLALVTAGFLIWLIFKNVGSIPLLDRLTLSGSTGVASDSTGQGILSAIAPHADNVVRAGDEGVTTSPLRPGGQADIEGELRTVYAGIGYVDRGTRVRVTQVSAMRIVVEPIDEGAGNPSDLNNTEDS